MNLTELARKLRVTPYELRQNLPLMGFDIGFKAIKINKDISERIIRNWPMHIRRLEKQRQEELEKERQLKKELTENKLVTIPNLITVRDFSNVTGIPINKVLSELMRNGIFASLNEKIDFDTAWLVGSELGFDIVRESNDEKIADNDQRLKKILDEEKEENMISRPPVIVIMGHVDHGKTSLLDAVRKTNVTAGEAGGITQHIGAYQIVHKNQPITFIDTPGHEAFTAMRSRGAKVADIAILIVAADDGVKPQTIEAFRIIEAAKIPFVVAINKIDRAGANVDKTKQELSSQLSITSEEWGGKIVFAPISAKNGTGITELLDMVLLVTETNLSNVKANPNSSAVGTIVESHIDKGIGSVATILIQNGTMRIGDNLMLNGVHIGKVKTLKNYLGETVKIATPSMPTQIIGLKTMPSVGDIVEVGIGEKVKTRKMGNTGISISQQSDKEESENFKKINLIIKSDVLGSAEAIEESLEKINTAEVKVKIIHKGLGNITDGDIKKAEAVHAKIIGFNVKFPTNMEIVAREKNIEVKLYSIIYNLLNDIQAEMKKLETPKYQRVEIGRLKVLKVFKSEKGTQIIGGRVEMGGRVENGAFFDIINNKENIGDGKITQLQAGRMDVKEVDENQECGLQIEGKVLVTEGDMLNIYKQEELK